MNKKYRVKMFVLMISLFISLGNLQAGSLRDGSPSNEPRPDEFHLIQIPSKSNAVKFYQVIFDFEVGRVSDTDWGQIFIKPDKFLRHVNACDGYVNAFIPDADGELSWVVENMFIHEPENKKKDKCGINEHMARERFFLQDPFVEDEEKLSLKTLTQNLPIVKFLDLRPGENGSGRMKNLEAVVLFSKGPLLNADEIHTHVVRNYSPDSFRVRRILNNAEGDLSGSPNDTTTGQSTGILSATGVVDLPRDKRSVTFHIGRPPASVITKPKVEFTEGFFPLGYFQEAFPNVNSGINACVPVSHANALAYLEHRYNLNPNIWDLPDYHVRGVGRIVNQGDVAFYESFPEWSISANVDFFTKRNSVFDLNTGGGSGACKGFRGVLGYLSFVSGNAPTMQVRHQGTKSTIIGDGADCDQPLIDLGGMQSIRQGLAPTWEWMRDQIIAGRSVIMGYGRYNEDGNWTGGHSVRVYGVSSLNGKRYIHWLDDGDQGNNFKGLRTLTFEVTDLHSPDVANVPNGILELDGMQSRQIVTAVSVEIAPKYIFP